MILATESPDSEDLNDQNFLEIYQSAMDLYGLIHARFILSPRGLVREFFANVKMYFQLVSVKSFQLHV
jgi:hypothetical protein